jgi:UDP-N-acetylglucosamine 2-epimerase (non-hydrolysing)
MTARWSTDRPETVLDAGGNVLIPLDHSQHIQDAVLHNLHRHAGRPRTVGLLYGDHVGENIVKVLGTAQQAGVDYWALQGMIDWVV